MFSVFINYRTDDEADIAALIKNELSHRFGKAKIFRATESIRLGDDFEQAILQAVRRSDVLLAVIGPKWLDVRDKSGLPKIKNEADWTRREILEAFADGVQVIPVLVGAVGRLSADDLPTELAQLARCQYMRFDRHNMEAEFSRLADTLVDLVPELAGQVTPATGHGSVTNNASGNARVGAQGVFTGNPVLNMGDTGEVPGDRGGR